MKDNQVSCNSVGSWFLETGLPSSEKRALLRYVLGFTQIQAMTERERILSEEESCLLNKLTERRLKGEPIPYLTGKQEFFSRDFIVNPSVLIPRPDTECLVEWLIENVPKSSTLVDLGTGSGCIAISLKLERPDLQVWASDNNLKALEVAKENAQALGADISFFESDWLSNMPEELIADVIVSNPPYIESNDQHLKALQYEPLYALTDFNDGLSCIRTIFEHAKALKKQPSIVAVEHGWDQGCAVRQIASNNEFYGSVTHKDYGDNDRFTVWVEA